MDIIVWASSNWKSEMTELCASPAERISPVPPSLSDAEWQTFPAGPASRSIKRGNLLPQRLPTFSISPFRCWIHRTSPRPSMTPSKNWLLRKLIFPFALVAFLAGCSQQADVREADSERDEPEPDTEKRWVYQGENGNLIYESDERGNRIPDFSNAGYGGGGVAIPDVPVKITLTPVEGDNTGQIQAAIDKLAMLDRDSNGFRGALLLKRGTYTIDGKLTVSASGIVIRGEGQDEDGTILIAAGTTKRTLIEVSGKGRPREVPGTRQNIIDPYVPVGAKSFEIENAAGFEVGDEIIVFRPSTAEWIRSEERRVGKEWRGGR